MAQPKPNVLGKWWSNPGFFRRAWRVDRLGLWSQSSLNTPEGCEIWQAYEPPIDMIPHLAKETKYEQPDGEHYWTGVVLAAQSTGAALVDVSDYGTGIEYYQFLREACRYFGKNLCIKLHPQGGRAHEERHRREAEEFGCACGYFGPSILKQCEFLQVYNSTYAIDAWIAGVNVMQHAPGIFSHTGAVTYTDWRFSHAVEDRLDTARRLLNFCVWRYCFPVGIPEVDMDDVTNCFIEKVDLFPLPENLSYGLYLQRGFRVEGPEHISQNTLNRRS